MLLTHFNLFFQEDEGIISDKEDDQEETIDQSHGPLVAGEEYAELDKEDDDENDDGSSSEDEFFDTEQEVPEVDEDLINRLKDVKVEDDKEDGKLEGVTYMFNDHCSSPNARPNRYLGWVSHWHFSTFKCFRFQ